MKVTDEMVDRANRFMWNEPYTRSLLEAALADVPEPDDIVKACDMARQGLETRITELAFAVQYADEVVEQLTAERDAVLERAEMAEREVRHYRSGFSVFDDPDVVG